MKGGFLLITPIKREKLYNLILSVLSQGDYTAREISAELYKSGYLPYPVRQAVAPRLTELEYMGQVVVVDSVVDTETHKVVSLYRKCGEINGRMERY